MISYLCRTYKQGRSGNFRSEPFIDRAAAEARAQELSRRGFFSVVMSTGHQINGQQVSDIYLCEYHADPRADEYLERIAAAGMVA